MAGRRTLTDSDLPGIKDSLIQYTPLVIFTKVLGQHLFIAWDQVMKVMGMLVHMESMVGRYCQ